jgi:hypothetical protein
MTLREAVRNLLILEHPEYVPQLGRTKTTKKLLDCENMLADYFLKLFKIINKNDMSVLASQQQFGIELHDKVLDCIQRSYFAGQDYVAKATKSTIPLTVQDVQIIQNQTADIEDRFWILIGNKDQKIESSIDQINNYLKSIASQGVFSINSTATQTGLQALQALNQQKNNALSPDAEPIKTQRLIFMNDESSNVCDLCEPLNGRTFEPDEEKYEIPLHHNCRCRYIIEDYESGTPVLG